MLKKAAVAVCALLFAGIVSASAGEETIGSLFNAQVKNNVPVKVYIKEVINQSGKDQIVPEAFKKVIDESLNKRRTIIFDVVNNPAESDIQMSAVIKNYQYMNRGPFKPSPGIQTTLLDVAATATENYVEMAVDYTVNDTKTGNVLWQGTVNEYIKQRMTPEESIPLIYDVVTRTFVWKCFGKASLREKKGTEVEHQHD